MAELFSMDSMRFCWITADCFVDVDMAIVPYLRDKYKLNIDWYVIRSYDSKTQLEGLPITGIFNLKHRQRKLKTFIEYRKIFYEIQARNYDVIYSDFVGFPFYYPALWIAKRKNQPIVHAAHNVIPYPVWPMSLRIAVKTIFFFNRHFHLFSKSTYKWFQEQYPNKSCFYAPMVVKHFGEVKTNNYIVDETKVNLLFFGNVLANKRLDLLIDAVKHLPENIRNKVHLNICGNCKSNKDAFLAQIGDCDSISVYFKRIPDGEIPELFTKHQFLMLPYQDVAQSGPHMIAYAYNLPVIASDIDGFSERIEDEVNGFLFKVGDKQSLIDVITKTVTLNNDAYSTMKTNLLEYVDKQYSLHAVADTYYDYFKQIIQ